MTGDLASFNGLLRFLTENLIVLDIGCRWGFSPHWHALGDHVTLIGFDADEVEVERLRAEFDERKNMHFYARTLGAEQGQATLIHRAEEAQSSLLETAWSRLAHLPDYDSSRIVGESRVELSTLDQWMDEHGVSRADALKLDTQGSELDILRGATTCLSAVRHVEVEVAFNPLFEAGPLFGDVDAFLRGQGYVLWRFRDLVSHALREAPDPPRVTEQLWYEGTPDPVSVRGGQLMWCNAHFVRPDMYLPDRRLGWKTRLRDACLMHALEFHDLAAVALERLQEEPGCPENVRAGAKHELAKQRALVDGRQPQSRPSMRTKAAGIAHSIRRHVGRHRRRS